MFDFKNCYFLRREYNISLMEIRAIESLAEFFKKKYGVKPEITTQAIENKSCIAFDLLKEADNYDEYNVYSEGDTIYVFGASTDAVNFAINRLIEIFTYFNDLSQLPISGKVEGDNIVDGYKQMYAEEFDGDDIPRGWMKHPPVNIGARGDENTKGVKRECWISNDNYKVEDGKLVLFGSTDGEKYYSAELRSSTSLLYKYGYIEISAKVCDGRGGCSGFWLLGFEDPLEYVKPEIDIFEVFGDGSFIKGTALTWPGKKNSDFSADSWAGDDLNHVNHLAGRYSFYTLPNGEKLSDGYHTYGLEWDEHHLIWYCDGNPFCRIAIDDYNSKRALSFHQEMFIILTQYMGVCVANRMDYPDENPDYDKMKMSVDYVRLYQREGQQINGRVTNWSAKRTDNIFGQYDRWREYK